MSSYKTLSKRKLQSLLVLEHASMGLTIRGIAEKTNLKPAKVQYILSEINETAKQELSLVIQSRVALEYEKSLNLLDYCLRRCVSIDSTTKDPRVSLQAISTILQINSSKNQLLSDSAMIARAIQKSAIVLPKLPSTALKDAGDKNGGTVPLAISQEESPHNE
jgi:hypothetical protein